MNFYSKLATIACIFTIFANSDAITPNQIAILYETLHTAHSIQTTYRLYNKPLIEIFHQLSLEKTKTRTYGLANLFENDKHYNHPLFYIFVLNAFFFHINKTVMPFSIDTEYSIKKTLTKNPYTIALQTALAIQKQINTNTPEKIGPSIHFDIPNIPDEYGKLIQHFSHALAKQIQNLAEKEKQEKKIGEILAVGLKRIQERKANNLGQLKNTNKSTS